MHLRIFQHRPSVLCTFYCSFFRPFGFAFACPCDFSLAHTFRCVSPVLQSATEWIFLVISCLEGYRLPFFLYSFLVFSKLVALGRCWIVVHVSSLWYIYIVQTWWALSAWWCLPVLCSTSDVSLPICYKHFTQSDTSVSAYEAGHWHILSKLLPWLLSVCINLHPLTLVVNCSIN